MRIYMAYIWKENDMKRNDFVNAMPFFLRCHHSRSGATVVNRQRKRLLFARDIYTSLADPDLSVEIHNMPRSLLPRPFVVLRPSSPRVRLDVSILQALKLQKRQEKGVVPRLLALYRHRHHALNQEKKIPSFFRVGEQAWSYL